MACGADVQGIIPEMAQADVAQEQRHSAGGAQEGPRRRKTGKGKLLTYLRSDRSKTRFSQTNQIHGLQSCPRDNYGEYAADMWTQLVMNGE